jgi:hypothetical protein
MQASYAPDWLAVRVGRSYIFGTDFRASGIGAGASPAIVLALVAFLATCGLINWWGHKLKEVAMNNQREKSRKSRSETCTVKRRITKLAKPVACIFDVVWAAGAGTVAAIVSPTLIH